MSRFSIGDGFDLAAESLILARETCDFLSGGFTRAPLYYLVRKGLVVKGTYIGSNKQIARKVTSEVKGIEQVTTAVESFRAFKLESDDRAGPRDDYTTTYWYSPETRSIVKYQFDATAGGQEAGLKRDIELIKFTPVK